MTPTTTPAATTSASSCPQLDHAQPPYGVAVGTWAKAVEAAGALGALIDDDASTSSDIIGAAQTLRALVRQYV